jgi:hypothetical protein
MADTFQRERGGEHVLHMARVRSKIAKRRGDAVSDLPDLNLDNNARLAAPASLSELSIGGELVPTDGNLRDTVTNPDFVTVDASRDRLELANDANVLELALDATDTAEAKNSLEKMLVHQMVVLHKATMKLAGRMDAMQHRPSDFNPQQMNIEQCRLAGVLAKAASAYQQGFVTLQRVRTGGRQHVTVQHVHVNEGGQAVVAGKIGGKRTGGRGAKSRRGVAEK